MDAITEAIKAAVREVIDERAADLADMSKPRLLSIKNAAHYLDCSTGYVRNLMANGTIPEVCLERTPGAREKPFVDRRDLDRLIEENRARGTDAA
jgi:hypothetical protein